MTIIYEQCKEELSKKRLKIKNSTQLVELRTQIQNKTLRDCY